MLSSNSSEILAGNEWHDAGMAVVHIDPVDKHDFEVGTNDFMLEGKITCNGWMIILEFQLAS